MAKTAMKDIINITTVRMDFLIIGLPGWLQ